MKTINLRKFYGSVYKTDTFIELPDEIVDALESEEPVSYTHLTLPTNSRV